jgi:hypothetical protein
MAFDAKVVQVMIASPGDVIEERESIRKTLYDWNNFNSNSQQIVLLPLGWETHSTPDLSGRAQGLINERILDKCDLLVGVFWTRLGTPTGEHDSGTVEEIKRHVSAGRTAMVYFSSRPVVPGSYNDGQYAKVVEFREWCKTKGLVGTFESLEDFTAKFKNDLQNILRDSPYLISLTEMKKPIESADQVGLRTVKVSELALDMLVSAVHSESGIIMVSHLLSGTRFQAGDKDFPTGGTRREEARHESAIEELENFGLISSIGHKGELYQVTDEGFEAVDRYEGAAT